MALINDTNAKKGTNVVSGKVRIKRELNKLFDLSEKRLNNVHAIVNHHTKTAMNTSLGSGDASQLENIYLSFKTILDTHKPTNTTQTFPT